MKYHKNPEFNELVVAAVEVGWRHEMLGNGHHRLVPPDTSKPMLVFPGTSRNFHSYGNLRAALKRNGVPV